MGVAQALGVVLVAILVVVPWMGVRTAASGDALAPFLAPFTKGLCDAVECGKGTCQTSTNHTFGFICECNQGWTHFLHGDHFKFLPCIIPNCSIDYSCSKDLAPAPAPQEPPTNLTIFDPCTWAYCGGGECGKISAYEHQCNCKDGYSNLFNISHYPCFRECSIEGECAKMGITLSNSTASGSTDQSGSSGSSTGRASSVSKSLAVWLFILTSLAMVRAA
ncbi:hypothetical protein J5N97_016056 [Dioscorea zingiberensis]|uniref:Uncharacterized protein n=1 Tax=Dioscorea zingiberensis TaxID=325984 RepID=A0A9D5CIN7_9LILI|nr:hypothetical protein J5N97_016056 [Dioscorea zingiberensis]